MATAFSHGRGEIWGDAAIYRLLIERTVKAENDHFLLKAPILTPILLLSLCFEVVIVAVCCTER